MRFRLRNGDFRVGRGLENDLVLLHSEIPVHAGVLRHNRTCTEWVDALSNERANLRRNSVNVGPYSFRVLRYRWMPVWVGICILLSMCLLFVPKRHMSAKKLVASEPQKIQLPARGAYGNLDSEQGGTRSALFTFQRAGREALLLHYTPGNIPSADRFILLINQQPVSYAPGCRGVWAVEERLILPEHHLKFGENTLEFRDRSPDLPAERWGIRDVYLTILGKDAIQAESPADLLETATRLFGERATYPGNLSRARKILDRAITLRKIHRESVPSQAVQLSRAIATAEALLISDALSRAKGMVSLGNRKQALAVYEELLAELDDPMDSRRAEVVRLIKELRR